MRVSMKTQQTMARTLTRRRQCQMLSPSQKTKIPLCTRPYLCLGAQICRSRSAQRKPQRQSRSTKRRVRVPMLFGAPRRARSAAQRGCSIRRPSARVSTLVRQRFSMARCTPQCVLPRNGARNAMAQTRPCRNVRRRRRRRRRRRQSSCSTRLRQLPSKCHSRRSPRPRLRLRLHRLRPHPRPRRWKWCHRLQLHLRRPHQPPSRVSSSRSPSTRSALCRGASLQSTLPTLRRQLLLRLQLLLLLRPHRLRPHRRRCRKAWRWRPRATRLRQSTLQSPRHRRTVHLCALGCRPWRLRRSGRS